MVEIKISTHTGTYAYTPISTHTYLKACISAHPRNGYIIAWNLILVIVHMYSVLMIFPFLFNFLFPQLISTTLKILILAYQPS